MQTNIIVKFSLEGFHHWKDAAEVFPEVAFLSDNHRHMFYFTCKKEVSHDDRDIEIILFKRSIIKYLTESYSNNNRGYNYLDFGGMSCEMICKDLMEMFKLNYCQVLEDNENGAETTN